MPVESSQLPLTASKWPSRWPCRSLILIFSAQGHKANLLATQFDLKFIPGFEVEHGCIGLAHHQVAIELNLGVEAELAATFAGFGGAAKINALSIKKCFIKSCEVQPLRSIPLVGDVAASPHEIRLADISKFFDLREEVCAGEHG